MEPEAIALLVYALTVLIPINGLLFIGMRRENMRRRILLQTAWRLHRK